MPQAPYTRRRWFQFGLGTMFLVVTLFAVWLGWNVNQVRKRNELIAYLRGLGQQPNPVRCWIVRCEPSKIPITWRLMGAKHDWATWLICNAALTDEELSRAKSILSDCTIEVHDP